MRLSKHTAVNNTYFAKDSRPSKKDWIRQIECGAVEGKIIGNTVYIDTDHLMSRDIFQAPANDNGEPEIDLLA